MRAASEIAQLVVAGVVPDLAYLALGLWMLRPLGLAARGAERLALAFVLGSGVASLAILVLRGLDVPVPLVALAGVAVLGVLRLRPDASDGSASACGGLGACGGRGRAGGSGAHLRRRSRARDLLGRVRVPPPDGAGLVGGADPCAARGAGRGVSRGRRSPVPARRGGGAARRRGGRVRRLRPGAGRPGPRRGSPPRLSRGPVRSRASSCCWCRSPSVPHPRPTSISVSARTDSWRCSPPTAGTGRETPARWRSAPWAWASRPTPSFTRSRCARRCW